MNDTNANAAPNSPAPRQRRLVWLWASVGLNVVLVALLIGGVVRAHRMHDLTERRDHASPFGERSGRGEGAGGERFGRLIESVPDETRQKVRAKLLAAGREARPLLDAARQARRDALTVVRAPDSTPEAIEAAFGLVGRADLAVQQHMQKAVISVLTDLPPELRERAAERLMSGRPLREGRSGERPAGERFRPPPP